MTFCVLEKQMDGVDLSRTSLWAPHSPGYRIIPVPGVTTHKQSASVQNPNLCSKPESSQTSQTRPNPIFSQTALSCNSNRDPSDREEKEKISTLLDFYTKSEGIFLRNIVIRHRTMKLSTDWCAAYYVDPNRKDPALKKLAMRILRFMCSASGCEHNWSTFEAIHTKKRNCLKQKNLNDLVFVQYN
ncbi:uncharacterized protein LOC131239701 [Magnolia sinica]|uniref:uncharacterized protein LOC131239701 n=1 Tax=Magnolia sinica TaxID=86752 RepID=UPI00265823AB|nr:uncharacterized protein LOC131239701 [Magnolia sinica]